MPTSELLRINLQALAKSNPSLALSLIDIPSTDFYKEKGISRDGFPVPLLESGFPAHSLYNPMKEASRTVEQIPRDSFPVFMGLGAGYAIREYLARNPKKACAVIELNAGALVSLLSLIDLTDILSDSRLTLVPEIHGEALAETLKNAYIPALHGGICVVPPSVHWLSPSDPKYRDFQGWFAGYIKSISADFSVQSHFGRLWNRNFWLNLRIAAAGCALPPADLSKTAVIAAAGPSLDQIIPDLKANRSAYCIIATDTAYGALSAHGIRPEYFVSIDAQRISAMHAGGSFHPSTCVVMELCGNPILSRLALRSGCPLYFTAGGHPLSRFAAAAFGLPGIRTESGTVTMAARDIAQHLGFTQVEYVGADFKYTGGKPYARGTYLAELYGGSSMRLKPGETLYTQLMFRAPTRTVHNAASGLDYRSDILDSYAAACNSWHAAERIEERHFSSFGYQAFVQEYCGALRGLAKNLNPRDPIFVTLLPFIAWYRRQMDSKPGKDSGTGDGLVQSAIELALTLIESYTTKP